VRTRSKVEAVLAAQREAARIWRDFRGERLPDTAELRRAGCSEREANELGCRLGLLDIHLRAVEPLLEE